MVHASTKTIQIEKRSQARETTVAHSIQDLSRQIYPRNCPIKEPRRRQEYDTFNPSPPISLSEPRLIFDLSVPNIVKVGHEISEAESIGDDDEEDGSCIG